MKTYISHGVKFNENQALIIVQGRDDLVTEDDVAEAAEMLEQFGLDPYSKQFSELPLGYDGFYAVIDADLGKKIHNTYPGSSVVIVDMPGDYGVELAE